LISEGKITSVIYSLLLDKKYSAVVQLLSTTKREDRAFLSILGFCYWNLEDYLKAVECYEKLSRINSFYQLDYAHALFKAGLLDQSLKVIDQITNPDQMLKAKKIKMSIKFQLGEISDCWQFVPEDSDCMVNKGCLAFREGKFEEALKLFSESIKLFGFQNDIAYNISLCNFVLKKYVPALKFLNEIVEKAAKEHPEFYTGQEDSVVDSKSLQESYLIEALNLKFAIEYQLRNCNNYTY
jgi:tetratricopeptide repeat protein 30